MPLSTGELAPHVGQVHTRGTARSDSKHRQTLCGEPRLTSQRQHSPTKSKSDVLQQLCPHQESWALSSPEFKGCHWQEDSPALCQPLSAHQGPAGLPLTGFNYCWGNSSTEELRPGTKLPLSGSHSPAVGGSGAVAPPSRFFMTLSPRCVFSPLLTCGSSNRCLFLMTSTHTVVLTSSALMWDPVPEFFPGSSTLK